MRSSSACLPLRISDVGGCRWPRPAPTIWSRPWSPRSSAWALRWPGWDCCYAAARAHVTRRRSVLGDRRAGDPPAHGQRRRVDIDSGSGRGQREHPLPALVAHLEVDAVGAVKLRSSRHQTFTCSIATRWSAACRSAGRVPSLRGYAGPGRCAPDIAGGGDPLVSGRIQRGSHGSVAYRVVALIGIAVGAVVYGAAFFINAGRGLHRSWGHQVQQRPVRGRRQRRASARRG